jgi:hypothetical protein
MKEDRSIALKGNPNITAMKDLMKPMVLQFDRIEQDLCELADAAMHAEEHGWRRFHVAVEVMREALRNFKH